MSAKRRLGEGGSGNFDLIAILLRGSAEWNEWRAAHVDVAIALRGANLRGANLFEANLRGADLGEATLTEAYLEGANLNLANLRGANLFEANLEGAKLLRANLEGAELRGANLRGADLGEATLTGATFTEATLTGADLTRADLREVTLTGADLGGANLTGANLTRANLTEAILRGTTLGGAELTGADLRGAELFKANLRRADLGGATLTGADLTRADLFRADLTRADLFKATLTEANLRGANLTEATLEEAILTGADLKRAVFRLEEFAIYTENDSLDEAEELFDSAKRFAEQLGFVLEDIAKWKRGSWWRRAKAAIKARVNLEQLEDRARMAENIFVGKQDVETTVELTNAAVALENAFKGKKGAVAIDLGLFIFLKKSDDGDTFFKRLSVGERAQLDKDPGLLGDPERLFQTIKDMNTVNTGRAGIQLEQAATSMIGRALRRFFC